MSVIEIKEFCERISSYGLSVKVRLKKESDVMVGKVTKINPQAFLMKCIGNDTEVSVRYAHVANITHT